MVRPRIVGWLAIIVLIAAACRVIEGSPPGVSPGEPASSTGEQNPAPTDGDVAPDVDLGTPTPEQPVSPAPSSGDVAPDVDLGTPTPEQPVSPAPSSGGDAPDMELGTPGPDPTLPLP